MVGVGCACSVVVFVSRHLCALVWTSGFTASYKEIVCLYIYIYIYVYTIYIYI